MSKSAAARLLRAIERATADKSLHTPDLGGKATTQDVTDAVCAALDIELLPHEALQQRGVIRQVIKDLRRGEAVAVELAVEVRIRHGQTSMFVLPVALTMLIMRPRLSRKT